MAIFVADGIHEHDNPDRSALIWIVFVFDFVVFLKLAYCNDEDEDKDLGNT